jgi:Ser/Thr protein kinase RdoA (MazF antagonist)
MLADAALVTGHLKALADLQLRLQAAAAPFFTGVKQRLAAHISLASELAAERKRALLAGLQVMPDGDQLCHFDFHPMNVLGPVDRPVVVDWTDACRGTAQADVCRSHVLLEIHAEPLEAPYLECYCAVSQCTADEVLVWRPFMLGEAHRDSRRSAAAAGASRGRRLVRRRSLNHTMATRAARQLTDRSGNSGRL